MNQYIIDKELDWFGSSAGGREPSEGDAGGGLCVVDGVIAAELCAANRAASIAVISRGAAIPAAAIIAVLAYPGLSDSIAAELCTAGRVAAIAAC